MAKIILFLSAVALSVLLFCGIAFPDSPVMWMAATTPDFALLRLALILMLIGLMVTNPPRNIYFRTVVSAVSVSLIFWSINSTYNNHMGFADTLSLLSVGIASFVTALERGWEEKLEKLQTVLKPESELK
jgi:hypothetical protein